jgi:hypothetical protein
MSQAEDDGRYRREDDQVADVKRRPMMEFSREIGGGQRHRRVKQARVHQEPERQENGEYDGRDRRHPLRRAVHRYVIG